MIIYTSIYYSGAFHDNTAIYRYWPLQWWREFLKEGRCPDILHAVQIRYSCLFKSCGFVWPALPTRDSVLPTVRIRRQDRSWRWPPAARTPLRSFSQKWSGDRGPGFASTFTTSIYRNVFALGWCLGKTAVKALRDRVFISFWCLYLLIFWSSVYTMKYSISVNNSPIRPFHNRSF